MERITARADEIGRELTEAEVEYFVDALKRDQERREVLAGQIAPLLTGPEALIAIDFAMQESYTATKMMKADLDRLKAEVERLVTANRYALATFRTLEQYTFNDSDHGLLIAEAVNKLEGAEAIAIAAGLENGGNGKESVK